MTEEEIWRTLGIDPTLDQNAIRAAYSATLKTIDADADPGAFVELRAAYDAARSGKRTPIAPVAETLDPGQAEDGFDARVARLACLFEEAAAGASPWLSPPAKAELRECWRGIAEDPRMAEIGFFGDAERTVSWLIARWGHYSVGLVLPVTEHFGWATREIDISTDDAIAEVVRRYRLVRFLQAVRKPGASHHGAWVELTSKAYPGSRRGRADPHEVFELLAVVREIWPELENEMDPQRVELWRDNTADPLHAETQALEAARSRRSRVIVIVLMALFLIVWAARLIAALIS